MDYLIKEGDTLDAIAKANNTTTQSLLAQNPYVTNPNEIYAGKTLAIGQQAVQPTAQPVAQPASQANPYADIEANIKQQNDLFAQQRAEQEKIINSSTNMAVAEYERNKQKADEEGVLQGKGAYTDYAKQINPYGIGQESLAQTGLANAGVAESTRTNIHNSYQKRVTETQNSVRNIKAEFDIKINEARMNGDIELAKVALQEYQQKVETLKQEYQMKKAQEQFDYEKTINERNFGYQKERDALADQRYDQEWAFNVEQANKSSSGSGGGSSGSSSYGALIDGSGGESGELSKNGEKMLYLYEMSKDKNQLMNAMNTSYSNGDITENDVRIIASKLGL